MITVDTCGMTNYSPLIPAIKAMCNANPGDKMENLHKNSKSVAGNRMSDERTGFGRKAKRTRSADTVFKILRHGGW